MTEMSFGHARKGKKKSLSQQIVNCSFSCIISHKIRVCRSVSQISHLRTLCCWLEYFARSLDVLNVSRPTGACMEGVS